MADNYDGDYAFCFRFGQTLRIYKGIILTMDERFLGQLQKIISRRSRKDQEGRDYQCGCGKRYLSYPALYTHIKTKHQGKQPQGTQKSGNSYMARRIKARISQQTLKQIYTLVQSSDLRLFTELQLGISGWVNLNSRIRKQSLPKQMFDYYLNLVKNGEFKLSCQQPLEHILTLYLIVLGDNVRDKFYEELVVFARICCEAYAHHGNQIYQAYFIRTEGPFPLSSFQQKHVKYFPIMADFIVSSYVPETCPNDINISLLELLLFDFCNWLYLKKLTPICTRLSQEYKLDYKLTFQKKPVKVYYLNEMQEKEQRQQNEELFESQSLNQIEEEMIEDSSKQAQN